MDKICRFCFNAYVDASLPKTEEELYFDSGLDDSNDFGSSTIGISQGGTQLYINSGNGEALNIEVCQWFSELNMLQHSGRWHTIAKYYPKFCPECGRELKEYKIDERGTSFTKERI